MSASRRRGFTLIELMVTLAVAAILLTIGVPSFRDLMIKSRLSGQIQEFFGTLNFARSEAIKRGNCVSICKSANSFTTNPSCGGTWRDGWIVFVDNGSGTSLCNGSRDSGELVLRVFPALPSNYTLTAKDDESPPNNIDYVTYDRFGMANDDGVGTFVFCANEENKARAINIIKTRPRIATEITSCTSP